MSYHKSMLPLGALGWPFEEAATYGYTDPDRIVPSAKLCGDAKAVQSALKDLGFYNGAIDGVLGKGSASAMAAYSKARGIGNISWPNAVLCTQLRTDLDKLIYQKYDERHPPQPQGGQPGGAIDPGGTVTPGGGTVTPGQAAPPVVDGSVDNTRTYLFVGGLAVFAVVGLGIVFALKSGGSPEPAGA